MTPCADASARVLLKKRPSKLVVGVCVKRIILSLLDRPRYFSYCHGKICFSVSSKKPSRGDIKALILSKEYKMIDCPVIQPKRSEHVFFHQTSSEDSSFYSKLLPEEASAKLSSMSAV